MRPPTPTPYPWGRLITDEEWPWWDQYFENLVRIDARITGESTNNYNCYAWVVGITNDFIEDWEIDEYYGDDDGKFELGDMDAFMLQHGFQRTSMSCATIRVYTKDGVGISHADILYLGNVWESKCGNGARVTYPGMQISGDTYGQPTYYYAPMD